MILIGYSGHAFVVYGILKSAGQTVTAYCDAVEKTTNPFGLPYLGKETSEAAVAAFKQTPFFISIGDNKIRRSICENLFAKDFAPANAVHPSAIICPSTAIDTACVMISAGVIINPLSKIGKGVILNTAAVIEHECVVMDFAHIAPGAVLCGNVTVGQNTFVGARSVVRQGITIGNNVTIGAGSVVVKNVPDNAVVMGTPAK